MSKKTQLYSALNSKLIQNKRISNQYLINQHHEKITLIALVAFGAFLVSCSEKTLEQKETEVCDCFKAAGEDKST